MENVHVFLPEESFFNSADKFNGNFQLLFYVEISLNYSIRPRAPHPTNSQGGKISTEFYN